MRGRVVALASVFVAGRAEKNSRLLREEVLEAGDIPEWMKQMDVEPGPPNCRWGGRG